MTEPLVLVVLLGSSYESANDAMLAATRRALGPDAIVLTHSAAVADDATALAVATRVRARAVVRVTWSGTASTRAHLHVHVAHEPEPVPEPWSDDDMVFGTDDAANEKGRTVGYAIATMVQRLEQDQAAPAPPPASAPVVPRRAMRDVDVQVLGVGAIGGAASAGGGVLGARVWLTHRAGIGARAGFRGGTVPAADATSRTWLVGGGPSGRFALGRSLAVGGRAELLVLRQELARGEISRQRWLGAGAVAGEVDWSVAQHVGLIAGAGAEVAFGPTPIQLGTRQVAAFPVLRALVELGARFRF